MDSKVLNLQRLVRTLKRPCVRRIAVLLVLGYVAWGIFGAHVARTSQPVSLEDADDCPIPLPSTACNIQFYRCYQFNFFIEYVKFEAPVEDCIGHIDIVRAAWSKDFDYMVGEFEPVSSYAKSPDSYFPLHKSVATWFDPETVQTGLVAGGGGSGVPRICVDTERGIFYYTLTD